jgi:hypothetical protein
MAATDSGPFAWRGLSLWLGLLTSVLAACAAGAVVWLTDQGLGAADPRSRAIKWGAIVFALVLVRGFDLSRGLLPSVLAAAGAVAAVWLASFALGYADAGGLAIECAAIAFAVILVRRAFAVLPKRSQHGATNREPS